MSVNKNKWLKIHAWMAKLGIREEDLEEHFTAGSGPGGQKINKTASAVFLKYQNITIKCQRARSRELNRFHAREQLCQTLEQAREEKRLKAQAARAKERQQNRKPTGAQKQKNLENKKHRSQKKAMRKITY